MTWISTGYTDPETGDWVDMSYDDGVGDGVITNPVDVTTAEPSIDQRAASYSDYESKKIQEAAAQATDPALQNTDWMSKIGTGAFNAIKARYTDTTGNTDWAKVLKDGLMAGAGLLAYNQASQPIPKTGYQGGIPSLAGTRQQLAPVAGARPGAGGQRYFTDTSYTPTTPTGQLTAAQQAAATQATQDTQATNLNAQNLARQQAQVAQAPAALTPEQQQAASDKFYGRVPAVQKATQGGLMGLAHGGSTTKPGGTYLQGSTDGMADKIHATIDGNQPARLAHGEFVIPADVVSHLGNGNSDAGAKQLYSMMDRIRQARTGTKKQGKEINPAKFTPGGITGYAAGGTVKHFATGDIVAPSGTTGTEQSLSSYAGPYVTDMLAKGEALSNQPYQAYQGPLSAGESDLQTQGFNNAANLSTPSSIGAAADTAGNVAQQMGDLSYAPTTATNQFNAPAKYDATTFGSDTFGSDQAKQYMNPYLQQSLDPQLAEARRQAEISRVQQAGQMTRSGAFGGSRQAISEAEGSRNLGTNLANITGQGYNTAFTNAEQQFNADQARKAQAAAASEQSKQFGATQELTAAQSGAQYGQAAQAQNEQANQFGANYGLQALQGQLGAAQTQGNLGATQNATGLANLNAQLSAGAQQRGIAQEGVIADQAAFNAERDNPYKMVQYQQSLLQGLPITAQNYSITNDPLAAGLGAAGQVGAALNGKNLYDPQTGAKLP